MNLFTCIFLILFISACALPQTAKETYTNVKSRVVGSYYLEKKKYREGIEALEAEVARNPESAEAHYYLGRCYLAGDDSKEALSHPKAAAAFRPDKPEYHFWLGVAYSANNESTLERRSYVRALELDPTYVPAVLYLGHSQLDKGEFEAALKSYNRVIEFSPRNPSALYNRALALNRLGRTAEEVSAWKEYIDVTPSGPLTIQAVGHLNKSGDFEYRNHLVGSRTITLEKIRFELGTANLHIDSYESLDVLGEMMKNNKAVRVHILSYQKDNAKLAEMRAKRVKAYLLEHHPEIESSRLILSWFAVPEEIKAGKKTYRETESINFLTAVKMQKEK